MKTINELPSALDNLIYYQASARRAGHTTLMLEGVHFDQPGIILFASFQHARMAFDYMRAKHPELSVVEEPLRLGRVQFNSLNFLHNLPEWMRGRRVEDLPPIIVDHFAMQLLIKDHFEKLVGGVQ